MRKDSIAIGGITLLITAAVVGGAWYVAQKQPEAPPPPGEATWSTLEPSGRGASSVPNVSAKTSSGRTDDYIICELPDGTKGYTNAASCEEANFENRLSTADPLIPVPKRKPYSNQGYQTPAQQAKSARKAKPAAKKPSLQLAGKSPPSGLNAGCAFAVGKALEIERTLSASGDPANSTWRENYCRWRCDAVERECAVADDYFYYRFKQLCPQEYWNGC